MKNNFKEPNTVTESIQMLNAQCQTNIIILVHGFIHDLTDAHPDKSSLLLMILSIKTILDNFSKEEFEKNAKRNEMNENFMLGYFNPKESLNHDVELLTFHLKFLEKIHNELA